MVYQIAVAYGLDKDPARKGEVLAIFGLALGGGRLIKAALRLAKCAIAGAMIGASSNAAMLYSLGYAACRFYEAKLDSHFGDNGCDTSSFKATERKLSGNSDRSRSGDGSDFGSHAPGRSSRESWSEIMPELQALNLSPTS